MPDASISCSVDVPAGVDGLVRYGLTELLRGLGLRPAWTRRGAQLAVTTSEDEPAPLTLRLSTAAVDALLRPSIPDIGRLATLMIDGEPWPLPVGTNDDTPGDVVASAAWWLAGLQEHATAERDVHGRFPYAASLQSRLGRAPGGPLRPAVDAYRQWLGARLRQAGVDVPGRTWGGAPWALALTHDLDTVRTPRVRALAGDAARGRVRAGLRRALGPDVRWRSARALQEVVERHRARSTWFVKPGAWAAEDVAHALDARYCKWLLALRDAGHEIGWHPGYGAHDHPARLATERGRFERALGASPALARTHFLRWAEPATPRLLRGAGVRIDSTLGFSRHEGFRRGTAHPSPLYDLAADRVTDLWEVPLAVMDTTLGVHRQLPAEDMEAAVEAVCEAARAVGGCAVLLWHNDLGEGEAWRQRLRVLDHSIGQARRAGATVGPLGRILQAWEGPL